MTFRFFLLLFFIQFWWDIVRRHFWPVERLPSKWSPGRRWCWSQGKDQRGRQERRQTPPDPSRCFSPFLEISDFVKKFYQRTTHSNTHPIRFPDQRRCWVLRSLSPKHCRWPSTKKFVSGSFALFSTNLCSLYLHQGVCVPLSFSHGGNFLDVSWNFARWVVDFLHLHRKYGDEEKFIITWSIQSFGMVEPFPRVQRGLRFRFRESQDLHKTESYRCSKKINLTL